MGRHIIFKCSYTGMNVQHWLEDGPEENDSEGAYRSVNCPACTRIHFIHRKTGKSLGDK
jgi:hypothetical protein